MDRFKNPFLEHKWISISMNYTSKMKMRNVPLIQQYYKNAGKTPVLMALGFAAYLTVMKKFTIEDSSAGYIAKQWESGDVDTLVDTVLADKNLWGTDLTTLPGFAKAVKEDVKAIQKDGIAATIKNKQLQKTVA